MSLLQKSKLSVQSYGSLKFAEYSYFSRQKLKICIFFVQNVQKCTKFAEYSYFSKQKLKKMKKTHENGRGGILAGGLTKQNDCGSQQWYL
jgi:hypothetical protein